MRTHATPIKSTGASQQAGHAGDGLASMRTHATPIKTTAGAQTQAGNHAAEDVGDYWLPWHIDSNFVT
eukprot:403256-Amphidinium_carterae.1